MQQGLPIIFFGDGEQTRDFVNVKDVVSANLLAMTRNVFFTQERIDFPKETLIPNAQIPVPGAFSIFNVATGRKHSLLQLLDTLEKISGNKVERSFVEARAGDIRHSLASSEKLQEIGWNPSVEFPVGLASLLE